MATGITLKVYNKDNKLKLSIRDSEIFKSIAIYKYNGEKIDTHTYILPKEELKPWQAYYELRIEEGGIQKENLLVSDSHIEHQDLTGEMETVRTTVNLDSKNRYEKRVKYFDGEKYEVEFKNGELQDFNFSLQENKINEYLKTLKQKTWKVKK